MDRTPCPFCGEAQNLILIATGQTACGRCGARAPVILWENGEFAPLGEHGRPLWCWATRPGEDALRQERDAAIARAVAAEREACAMLHEDITLELGAKSAVLEYRDKIRARGPQGAAGKA